MCGVVGADPGARTPICVSGNFGKFPLVQMGVLAPGSAHARPSAQPPIDTSGNFSVYVSLALASLL